MKKLSIIILITTLMILSACTNTNNIAELSDEWEPSYQDKLEEYMQSYEINEETLKSDKQTFENPTDLSYIEEWCIGVGDETVSIESGNTFSDINSTVEGLIYTADIDKELIENSETVTIDYIMQNEDEDILKVSVVSHPEESSEHIDFEKRKIDTINIEYDTELFMFDTPLSKDLKSFIKKIGTPTYKYTLHNKDPYRDNTEETLSYAYEYYNERFSLILLSMDDTTISKISIEIK